MSTEMIKTTKFDNMLQAFECDLSLARDGEKKLSELQNLIEEKDESFLRDIELLEELSFLIRHGKAEIRIATEEVHIVTKTFWFIASTGSGTPQRTKDGKIQVWESEAEATKWLEDIKGKMFDKGFGLWSENLTVKCFVASNEYGLTKDGNLISDEIIVMR